MGFYSASSIRGGNRAYAKLIVRAECLHHLDRCVAKTPNSIIKIGGEGDKRGQKIQARQVQNPHLRPFVRDRVTEYIEHVAGTNLDPLSHVEFDILLLIPVIIVTGPDL